MEVTCAQWMRPRMISQRSRLDRGSRAIPVCLRDTLANPADVALCHPENASTENVGTTRKIRNRATLADPRPPSRTRSPPANPRHGATKPARLTARAPIPAAIHHHERNLRQGSGIPLSHDAHLTDRRRARPRSGDPARRVRDPAPLLLETRLHLSQAPMANGPRGGRGSDPKLLREGLRVRLPRAVRTGAGPVSNLDTALPRSVRGQRASTRRAAEAWWRWGTRPARFRRG